MKPWTDNSPLDLGKDELKRFDEAIPALLKPLKTLKEKYENLIVYSHDEKRLDDLSVLTGFFEKSDDGTPNPGNLRTTNLMGVINYRKGNSDPIQISIGSRFDKDNKGQPFLTYMLMRAFDGIIVDWKPRTTPDNWNLLLIFLFKHHLCKAYRQGLLKQYVLHKYNDYNFKGALDVSRFIHSNTPFLGKISYSAREYTTDNPVLWLIRRAADYIGSEYPAFYHSLFKTNQESSEALRIIAEATPSYERQTPYHLFHPCQKPIRHPFYFEYEDLRKVCLQLLRKEGLSLYGNDNNKEEIYGVLFDGAWLWECFVASLLKSVNGNFKHYKYGEEGIQVFEDNKRYSFFPDFYDGKNVVLDAKYKVWQEEKDRADIHQVFSYMYLTGATKGGVIFPGENGDIKEGREIKTKYCGMWYDIPLRIPQGIGNKEFYEVMDENIKNWKDNLKKRLYPI